MNEESLVSKKHPKEQPTLSTDSLLETSKKGDIELTEQELGKVSGGLGTAKSETKDIYGWVRNT
jgi:hypothetical protein